MHRINDTNNYFNASSLGATLGTNVGYTMVVRDATNATLATYAGTIYYYNAAQQISYNDLVTDLMPQPSELTNGSIEVINYWVTVKLYLTSDLSTAKATANVILSPAADWRADGLTDEDYDPTTSTAMRVMQPSDVETPRVAVGMVYPLAVAVDPTIDISDYQIYRGASIYALTAATDELPFVLGIEVVTATEFNVRCIEAGSGASTAFNKSYEIVCDAQYMLLWWDNRGFWQCQPFNGSDTLTAERLEVTNTNSETRIYRADVCRSFALKSQYAHKQATYETLISSPSIYLYNTSTGKQRKVLLDNTTHTNKVERGAKQIEITVKYARTDNNL